MLFKQKPQVIILVIDAATAQGVPGSGYINWQYRFTQPLFNNRKVTCGRKIGSDLDNCVDIIAINLAHNLHYLVFRYQGDRIVGVFAAQPDYLLYVVT